MKHAYCTGALLLASLTLSGCSEEALRAQAQPQYGATATAPVRTSSPAPKEEPIVVPKHNLSRVAAANRVSPQQLDALQVGEARREQVIALLGEIEPFTLGGGKQILRYDVGKFVFDSDGVLIRKFLTP